MDEKDNIHILGIIKLKRIDAFELWCWRRLLTQSLGLQGDPTSPSKGDQSWVFFGRTDAKDEPPVFRPRCVKS